MLNLIFHPISPSVFTAVTHVFLHGGYLHLAGNIVYLVIFGRAVEDRFGPARFAAIFTLTAIAGAYMHLFCVRLFSPADLAYGVIGASGATSGLLGAFLVRFYFSRVRVAYWVFLPLQGINRAGRTHVPVIFALLLWVLLQVTNTLLEFGGGISRVAYSLHVAGFAAGTLLAVLFGGLGAARAESHLARARRWVEEANWFGAQGEFINYLEQRPREPEIHAEAARAFICGSEPERAFHHYRESVRLFLEAGARDIAESIFTEAMRVIPGFILDEKTHLNLAFGMERTLKFHAAGTAYENFLLGYPLSVESPLVLLRMAGLLERRFLRCGEAFHCYQRLVESYPGDIWVDYARSEMDRLGDGGVTLS
ncbi:MAG TPA: rhomboid family intramembrane serine protease [Patescibacteria group bacterium]|nr:rhomboid family intramembrane serine protease [Patescibacteria group bacterium]